MAYSQSQDSVNMASPAAAAAAATSLLDKSTKDSGLSSSTDDMTAAESDMISMMNMKQRSSITTASEDNAGQHLPQDDTQSLWMLGDTVLSAELIRFLFIATSMLAVMCVGLYNMTVGTAEERQVWGPIVASAFFSVMPGPSISPIRKKSSNSTSQGGTFRSLFTRP